MVLGTFSLKARHVDAKLLAKPLKLACLVSGTAQAVL